MIYDLLNSSAFTFGTALAWTWFIVGWLFDGPRQLDPHEWHYNVSDIELTELLTDPRGTG